MEVHFVVHEHPVRSVTDDVVRVARTLFGENRFIVAKHADVKNHHFHCHGVCATFTNVEQVKAYLKEAFDKHPLKEDARAAGKKGASLPRPWGVNDPMKTDTYGFQYLMHCGVNSVVCSQGFTGDELIQLACASLAAVAETKSGLVNHLKRKFTERPRFYSFPEDDYMSPKGVHRTLQIEAVDYLRKEKVEHIVPANIRNQVFTFYHQAEWVEPVDKDYLACFY